MINLLTSTNGTPIGRLASLSEEEIQLFPWPKDTLSLVYDTAVGTDSALVTAHMFKTQPWT